MEDTDTRERRIDVLTQELNMPAREEADDDEVGGDRATGKAELEGSEEQPMRGRTEWTVGEETQEDMEGC